MIYGNNSISQYTPSNLAIWLLMAFQAGMLNIGGFMSCHRFVSHVTGFATYFGYEVNQGRSGSATTLMLVPLFFLFGAMLSGFLVDLRLKLRKRPKYYITCGIMFALILSVLLLGLLGVFGIFGEPFEHSRDYTLLTILCLVCGIQNGMITTVSRSIVRTTHLTGITTDLGIGIVRYLNRSRLPGVEIEEGRGNLMRIGIILSFALGSIAGGFAFGELGFGGFIGPTLSSGLLFGVMLYFQVLKAPKKAP